MKEIQNILNLPELKTDELFLASNAPVGKKLPLCFLSRNNFTEVENSVALRNGMRKLIPPDAIMCFLFCQYHTLNKYRKEVNELTGTLTVIGIRMLIDASQKCALPGSNSAIISSCTDTRDIFVDHDSDEKCTTFTVMRNGKLHTIKFINDRLFCDCAKFDMMKSVCQCMVLVTQSAIFQQNIRSGLLPSQIL